MPEAHEMEVEIRTDGVALRADLVVPTAARGIVAFAHGSGSGRLSPRNRQVAAGLHEGGFATLLLDLLTEREARVDDVTRHLRFDVALLARRLVGAIAWLAEEPATAALPLGLYGASTGAAAALTAAAEAPDRVAAVVSRGGRPDLAGFALARVRAPTLLIVGERDTQVIVLNERAQRAMTALNRLMLVPDAGHLFEEPGALEAVVALTRDWFDKHLRAA
jgi:putative phosphoribosyl transferase